MTNREVAERTMQEIENKIGHLPACPFCNKRNWTVSDMVTLTGSINVENNSVNPASGVPGISMSCTNCGYTASINPKVIGVME